MPYSMKIHASFYKNYSLVARKSSSSVAGRSIFLKTQFEGLAVDFAAEHGSYIEQDGEAVLSALDESWLPKIEQIFENWTREHPGSHYEKKQNAIAWHYRETTLTGVTADELIAQLPRTVSKTSLRIIHGKKVIKVLPQSINKGTASLLWLSNRSDFVLAAGDDTTDEDMFAVVNSRSGETVKIGKGETAARHRLKSPSELTALLAKLLAFDYNN